MNITVFGSTDLTLSVLNFLYDHSYTINAIITTPETFKINYKLDGVKNFRFVDLNKWGMDRSIPVVLHDHSDRTFTDLNNLKTQSEFALVVGWYHMVPKKIRELFQMGCGGFHVSLLPKLRGGAPLNWAILLGYQETGVSFFELSDGVDDGLLYAQDNFPIHLNDDIGTLVKKCEDSILNIIGDYLPKIMNKTVKLYKQQGLPSYCGQRLPEDSQILWDNDAETILRLIRASGKPYSGAYSFLDAKKITFWKAELSGIEIYGVPGQIFIMNNHVYVSCRNRALLMKETDHYQLLLVSNHRRLK